MYKLKNINKNYKYFKTNDFFKRETYFDTRESSVY